jgi:predicted DCC family thiol-disulfide oxidoreductase YuxK
MTTTQTTAAQELPSPAERPDADVVIYDGDCRFCTGQVRRLHRWDKGHRLAFISLHDPLVSERWPDLTHDMLMAEMFVVDRSGQRHGGATAARYLSRRLPQLWWLAPLLHIPFSMPLWRWMYRQVAKRRYWLAGKARPDEACDGDACKVHLK